DPGRDRDAIEIHFRLRVGADHQEGLADLAVGGHVEGFTEEAVADGSRSLRARDVPEPAGAIEHVIGAAGILAASDFLVADPRALPSLGVEEAHSPLGGLAPAAGLSLTIPYLHLPERGHSGGQGFPMVGHLDRLVGWHLAAIPEVAGIGCQATLAGCDQD